MKEIEVQELKNGISIIVAFYYGNAYIQSIYENVSEISKLLCSKSIPVELIVVNDSPNIAVDAPVRTLNYSCTIINNPHNIGIHGTRVNGLRKAVGDWILFFDQDDELSIESFPSQFDYIQDADLVIGNGYNAGKKGNRLFFANYREMKVVLKEAQFIKGRNYIRSPGQCLIRKTSIPICWIDNPLTVNGADDWFLWLEMFNQNVRVRCNPAIVYVHNQYDEKNLSFDYEKMRDSSLEMCDKLRQDPSYPNRKVKKLIRTIEYRYVYLKKDYTVHSLFRYANLFVRNTLILAYRRLISRKPENGSERRE